MSEDPEQRRLDEDEVRCRLTAAHCSRRRQQFIAELAEANAMCARAEEALIKARDAAKANRTKGEKQE